MSKKVLLFAPAAMNLAETTRMIEIAKGIRRHPEASQVFDIQFISDGGEFEHLIEEEGFALKKMEPRLTPEKIEYLYKIDKGEKFGSGFSYEETITRVENEMAYLKEIQPTAVLTGSYVTIPLTCQIMDIPLVWTVQSTWFEAFFTHGAGMTDNLKIKLVKKIADWGIFIFTNLWMRIGIINVLNKVAKQYGVPGFQSIFDYWRGNLNLVAEPAEFTDAKLPPNYYFIGPLIARQDFPIPEEIQNLPHDKPLIYFAMGSSGTPEIVANLVESFEGKPYRVIAPVKSHLEKLPKVNIPENVLVTDWLPAHKVNKLVDLSVIHGGIGTILTAAYAGKPVVGIGMQPEQDANIAALVRKGFAIRVPKSKDPSQKVQAAIEQLLYDDEAKQKAAEFARVMGKWDGPQMAADILYEKFSSKLDVEEQPHSAEVLN
jgi:UDP:flavonoid glycosyltransferase YjiC (YdhE family)